MGLTPITLGYVPLLDSAVLIAAQEQGFAEAEGLEFALVRETSWANIRDRVAVGHFDAAHMLAPMPLSANLGLTPLDVPLVAPMALGLGGNAVTVSLPLWRAMEERGQVLGVDAGSSGTALARVIADRRSKGLPALRFGVVHPESGHNYELRYWLAASGVDTMSDIEIVVVPPPFLPDALRAGRVDGYCVGEPFNSVAVARGVGRIVTTKSSIWRSSPEKVLGVRREWAERFPEQLAAVIRAITRAARWCADPDNRDSLAGMLAREDRLGISAPILIRALTGRLFIGETDIVDVPDFFLPFERAANFPWISHALWFYSQMVRWRQVDHTAENAKKAARTYRPDIYRAALDGMGIAVPSANAKIEGALTEATAMGAQGGMLSLGPDGFFDGTRFDLDRLDAYIAGQQRVPSL
ncbi:CmpA/NrtA family ABC transporter substrate-binding protein [Pelagibacterium halotolerans]|uniref:Nitrate ABC transporter, nitrate-binding protein n=1 Tax=Pelagibacterium halotolerans (strain DSM 22347 / JCM 15775 / CGMCC 1.7692 / B2) TaxID=1082931 RepID=G4R896_PELHB|nr:CmpA/NrtA family ABC transporter substrate-binding protein [Pelagibacterium halotolerans]AEQ52340.1 nitrate ABC transporter, nitrate-binding protein [Pelagibacterium halotolerans B2]QJR17920.1 ABC transporter substrate-binding protein [Pelagibacterium halotolerans]SEA33760.1 NitT/TauT family transport system ATP-binding protein [Pelagibacterium halotolerans]